jgi:hypothetical protein
MGKPNRDICKHKWKTVKKLPDTIQPPPKEYGLKFGKKKKCINCGALDLELVSVK